MFSLGPAYNILCFWCDDSKLLKDVETILFNNGVRFNHEAIQNKTVENESEE